MDTFSLYVGVVGGFAAATVLGLLYDLNQRRKERIAATTLEELVTTTIRARGKEIAANVTNNNALLTLLRERDEANK